MVAQTATSESTLSIAICWLFLLNSKSMCTLQGFTGEHCGQLDLLPANSATADGTSLFILSSSHPKLLEPSACADTHRLYYFVTRRESMAQASKRYWCGVLGNVCRTGRWCRQLPCYCQRGVRRHGHESDRDLRRHSLINGTGQELDVYRCSHSANLV